MIYYYRKDPPTHTPTRFALPAARGKTSLNGEKERNYLFQSYTDLE